MVPRRDVPASGDRATLTARPLGAPDASVGLGGPGAPLPRVGQQVVGVAARRDALLHLPPAVVAGRPGGLVVVLHGAGGDAGHGLALLRPLADEHGLVLLAPASRGPTWDAVGGAYGPDVDVVDRALERLFAAVPVDPGRVAVAGFSDGASYALGLGLANGELFSRVVAFSPGFIPVGPRAGRPAVFVSHGEDDAVLPVQATSRRIVPGLRRDGYDVTYEEFDGTHTVPPEVARRALDWLGW